MEPYSIVPIQQDHIEGFRAALDRVAREKRYLALLKAPPFEDVRRFIFDNIKQRNPQFVVVANASVIGWCDVVRSVREISKHCGVLGLALVPEYRGRGIGARLMATTIAAAWQRRFTRIELTVREDNANAMALYRRFGFEVEGVRRNAYRIDGEYLNIVAMALLKEAS